MNQLLFKNNAIKTIYEFLKGLGWNRDEVELFILDNRPLFEPLILESNFKQQKESLLKIINLLRQENDLVLIDNLHNILTNNKKPNLNKKYS